MRKKVTDADYIARLELLQHSLVEDEAILIHDHPGGVDHEVVHVYKM